MTPDISRARTMANAIVYYAQELRNIREGVSHQATANTVERMAKSIIAALEAAPVVTQDMVGHADE